MKNSTLLRLLLIVLTASVLCSAAACNKNDGEAGENGSASVVSEQSVDPLVDQWQSEELPEYVYTFNADGTGQYDMAGKILKLNYSTANGKITISFLEEGYSPVTLDYELDGDKLNIKDSFGKDTFYLRADGSKTTD